MKDLTAFNDGGPYHVKTSPFFKNKNYILRKLTRFENVVVTVQN